MIALSPGERFAVPPDFLRSPGARVHVSDRIADRDRFRIVAGMASVAREFSTRIEDRRRRSGDPPSAKRARDWLVISEIALTLTLLVAAAT